MLIQISDKIGLRITNPIWLHIQGEPQLELFMPKPFQEIEIEKVPPGYILRTLNPGDEYLLMNLLNRADFSFDFKKLQQTLSICLPNGCFIIEHQESGKFVATMMARHLASSEYPFGGRIDWLAVDPAHQGKGLGNICAKSATAHLIKLGYKNIWVTTDVERIAALKIFLSIGFEPVIINESRERWKIVYNQLNIPNSL